LGLTEDEVRFYDALAHNESAVRELTDETLKKIAHELTENLRKNLTVDWSQRDSVQAKLRLMVKRILRKYKYPPDLEVAAVELVLRQAEALARGQPERVPYARVLLGAESEKEARTAPHDRAAYREW
jgi:type I restriction enzyme R subunit